MKNKIYLTLFLGLCSCEQIQRSPNNELAYKKISEKYVNEKNQELVEVVDFKKTDGVKTEVFGQQTYLYEYRIVLKFKQDVNSPFEIHNNFLLNNFSRLLTDAQLAEIRRNDSYRMTDGESHHYYTGDTVWIFGHELFEKTENGWR